MSHPVYILCFFFLLQLCWAQQDSKTPALRGSETCSCRDKRKTCRRGEGDSRAEGEGCRCGCGGSRPGCEWSRPYWSGAAPPCCSGWAGEQCGCPSPCRSTSCPSLSCQLCPTRSCVPLSHRGCWGGFPFRQYEGFGPRRRCCHGLRPFCLPQIQRCAATHTPCCDCSPCPSPCCQLCSTHRCVPLSHGGCWGGFTFRPCCDGSRPFCLPETQRCAATRTPCCDCSPCSCPCCQLYPTRCSGPSCLGRCWGGLPFRPCCDGSRPFRLQCCDCRCGGPATRCHGPARCTAPLCWDSNGAFPMHSLCPRTLPCGSDSTPILPLRDVCRPPCWTRHLCPPSTFWNP